MDASERSVRVEVDPKSGDHSGPDAPEIGAPKGGGSFTSNVAVAVGIAALLIVGGIFLFVRPEDGQTAANTPRQATTTTTVPPSTTPADPDDETTASPDQDEFETRDEFVGQVAPERISDVQDLLEIVESPIGFLGLSAPNFDTPAETTNPTIVRSFDGRTWTVIDTVVAGEDPNVDNPVEGVVTTYAGLTRAGDGYSLLRSVRSLIEDPNGDLTGEATLERLVSAQGLEWQVVEDFPTFDGDATFPFTLSERYLMLVVVEQRNSPLAQLIERNVAIDLDGPVCFADRFGENQLQLFLCSGGASATIEADDLFEPDGVNELFTCVEELFADDEFVPRLSLTIFDAANSELRTLDTPRQPLAPPVVLADGTVLMLADAEEAALPTACENFDLPVADAADAAVLRWSPGSDTPETLRIPPEVTGTQPFEFFEVIPRAFGNTMILLADETLWRITKDGDWTSVAEIPPVLGGSAYIDPQGRFVVVYEQQAIEYLRFDADGNLVGVDRYDVTRQIGDGQISFANEHVVIFNTFPTMWLFDLNLGETDS